MSDLSGRAEELEREAADLRRENGWLKEIVMLKGSPYATAARAQQRMALSQAVQAAGIDLTVEGGGQPDTRSAKVPISGVATHPEKNSSEEESDDSSLKAGKKEKGKKTATRGKRK